MSDIRDIVSKLGRRNLEARIGCKPTALTNALARGTFPSAWFLAVSELAREHDVEVPVGLFRFKVSSQARERGNA